MGSESTKEITVQMKKTILILGGGFGGVYTAVHLNELMTREESSAATITSFSSHCSLK